MRKILVAVVMLIWVGTSWASSPGFMIQASGYEKGNAPGNVIDGDEITHWTCRGECSITIQAAGNHVWADSLYIEWKNLKRENFFDIAVSRNGKTWRKVFSGSSNDFTEPGVYQFDPQRMAGFPPEDQDGGQIIARYFRVIGHGNSVSDHNSILEMAIFLPEGYGTGEWGERLPVAVTASSFNKENAPERAMDDNLATHWTADNVAWIEFDLGYLDTVENVKIAWLNGDKRKADFDIEVSLDGGTWEPAFSGTSTGGTKALENNMFQERCARYIRIVSLGNDHPTQKDKNSIAEVQIWGYGREGDELTCEEEYGSDEIEPVATTR